MDTQELVIPPRCKLCLALADHPDDVASCTVRGVCCDCARHEQIPPSTEQPLPDGTGYT